MTRNTRVEKLGKDTGRALKSRVRSRLARVVGFILNELRSQRQAWGEAGLG